MLTFSETTEGIVVITPEGKFSGTEEDRQLYDSVREWIEKKDRRKMVIDFSRMKWANSAGIGIIVSAYLTARRNGGDIRMACANDKILHYFKISKLESVFEIFDNVEQAVESFAKTVQSNVTA